MGGGWAAKMKYDGCRLVAAVGGGEPPVLWTRNLNVVTSSYPEVAEDPAPDYGPATAGAGDLPSFRRSLPDYGLLPIACLDEARYQAPIAT
ncbi:hypothetical protein M2275_000773 [Rhodococcus opacus]|nr:hypothetical protein [Rhodococcus opacus]